MPNMPNLQTLQKSARVTRMARAHILNIQNRAGWVRVNCWGCWRACFTWWQVRRSRGNCHEWLCHHRCKVKLPCAWRLGCRWVVRLKLGRLFLCLLCSWLKSFKFIKFPSTCSATMLRHAQQPCFDRPATLRWEGAAKIQRSPQQSVLLVRNALLGRWIFDTRVEMEWITKPCERITCGETIRPVAGEVLILFCYSYILRRKFSCFTKETPLQTFQS